jgi:tungstate transport system ATP-binding protein
MSETAYQFERVCFRYPRGGFALSIDELTVERASVVALGGPNGSGKTTLLLLLAFISRPSAGEIRFFGSPVATAGDRSGQGRQKAVLVPYPPYLFRGTGRHNLCLGLEIRRVPRPKWTGRLEPVIEALDLGPLLDRSCRALSAGQAQRLAIARALVLQPEVLLLDEPFASLDQEQSKRLSGLLHRLNRERGLTIIYSAHRGNTTESLPPLQTVRLNEGRVFPAESER